MSVNDKCGGFLTMEIFEGNHSQQYHMFDRFSIMEQILKTKAKRKYYYQL